MHTEMSDFETTNLHCFVAPGSNQIALEGIATSLDAQTTSGYKKNQITLNYKNKLSLGPFSICLGANITAAEKHKPKGALAAPGIYYMLHNHYCIV